MAEVCQNLDEEEGRRRAARMSSEIGYVLFFITLACWEGWAVGAWAVVEGRWLGARACIWCWRLRQASRALLAVHDDAVTWTTAEAAAGSEVQEAVQTAGEGPAVTASTVQAGTSLAPPTTVTISPICGGGCQDGQERRVDG